MTERLTMDEPAGRDRDMREAVKAIAANVCTLRATLALVGAGYDSVTIYTVGVQRKLWGRVRELLTTGWDDHAIMEEARQALREVVDQLVETTRRFRGTSGSGIFTSALVSLVFLSVVTHVAERRAVELREQQAAAAATATDAGTAGGGENTVDGADRPRAA